MQGARGSKRATARVQDANAGVAGNARCQERAGAQGAGAGVAGNALCKGYWRCKHCLHSNNKAARLFRALQHIKQHSEWKNK